MHRFRSQESGFQNPSTIPLPFSIPTQRSPIEQHSVRSLLRISTSDVPCLGTLPVTYAHDSSLIASLAKLHARVSIANEEATSP
ncbi:hypothetical protein ERO13_A09G120850v2 [Gossypium hirsutum]|nr:hypothetical protein ERO13_A09G120850v2 [Gossypium hirsutum]